MTKEEKKELISLLIAHVVENCDKVDDEKAYDEMLDEAYREDFEKCSLTRYLRPSEVQKECSPTDYRVGCADFSGTNDDWVEVGCPAELYDLKEVEAAREEFLETFEADLTQAQKDLEAVEETLAEGELVPQAEGMLKEDRRHLTEEIKELNEKLGAIKYYTF